MVWLIITPFASHRARLRRAAGRLHATDPLPGAASASVIREI